MKQLPIKNLHQLNIQEVQHLVGELKTIALKYRCALREIETKFATLNDEYKSVHSHNPIEHMKSRIKTPESILEKLQRKGLPVTSEGAEQLTDIAGIRVVCSFLSDVYDIANSITSQKDITVLRRSDYIKNPKPHGYRSLHIIVSVPVFFSSTVENVPVEIQLRTVSMDTWASLEHKLRYKYNGELPDDISDMLLNCADITSNLDHQMMTARDRLFS